MHSITSSLVRAFYKVLSLSSLLFLFECGCQDGNQSRELRLSTLEDAPNIDDMKAGASFDAELVELYSAVETNGVTNSYQFVLRDRNGLERVFSGINASEHELEVFKRLNKTSFYTFPNVLFQGRGEDTR